MESERGLPDFTLKKGHLTQSQEHLKQHPYKMSVMCLSWSYSLIDLLITQGPREQLAVLAQTAADPHVAAVGLLHRCQRHLDGVSQ